MLQSGKIRGPTPVAVRLKCPRGTLIYHRGVRTYTPATSRSVPRPSSATPLPAAVVTTVSIQAQNDITTQDENLASDTVPVKRWNLELWTHVPARDVSANIGFDLEMVSLDGETMKAELRGTHKPVAYDRKKEYLQGRKDFFAIDLPDGFEPAAVLINDRDDAGDSAFRKDGDFERLFVKRVVIAPSNSGNSDGSIPERAAGKVTFTANSYVSVYQDYRLFVRDDAWSNPKLRDNKTIDDLQENELKELRGEGSNQIIAQTDHRKPGDRIYRFATYNDLGDLRSKTNPQIRPTLGGSAEYPYPRRIDTNRDLYPGTEYELPPDSSGVMQQLVARLPFLNGILKRALPAPWVPDDDNFDSDKSTGFIGNAILGTLPAVLTQLDAAFSGNFLLKPLASILQLLRLTPGNTFDSIPEVLSLYDKAQLRDTAAAAGAESKVVPNAGNRRDFGGKLRLSGLKGRFNARTGISDGPNTADNFELIDIIKYDVPRSLAGRLQTWSTDEEFGRLFLAGHNPLVIEAVSSREALKRLLGNSSIRDTEIKDLLEGHSFEELVSSSAPRLFIVDYWAIFDLLPEANNETGGVQHAGRAVMFKRTDGYLVPVAIELTDHQEKTPTVYTGNDPQQVWELAKMIFLSIDSGYHQLISHFLRTHACVEPYLIATRRQLSLTHPIFRLLMAHFRYTLPINAAARSLLIKAGGVIEENFTPGSFSMALSSKVYGLTWQFKDEGLVADLKKRGFMDGAGNLLLKDYPYAEDGLEIWTALHKYFTAYVDHYYTDDAEVQTDKQLNAWWKDIQEEGHPDANKSGWIELSSKSNLVNICCTIAWVASAHHAAVNFGQYDYSGWMVSHASLCRKPAPMRDSQEWKALAEASGGEYEKQLLSWLSPPVSATKVMSTVKLLSSHAVDEQYLASEQQDWLPLTDDSQVHNIFKTFVADMAAVEQTIRIRNEDPNSIMRNRERGGMAYTLLIPNSENPGVTMQGVPYSISI